MAINVPRPAPTARRASWIVLPVIIALASRVFSAILLLLRANDARALPQLIPDSSPFVAWDGQWYLHIVQFGYHAAPLQSVRLAHYDFAFFPGWPLLIRLVSLNGLLPTDGTAVLLANFLFVLVAIAAYRLFADRFGQQAALWGTILLAFNPAAYVFSMAYSETLFVLMAVLYFLDGYGRRSPIFAALATVARATGLAIGASAAVMFVLGKVPRRRLVLIGAAVAITFAAWCVILWTLTGSFTAWYDAEASWGVYRGLNSILRDLTIEPLSAAWLLFVGLMILGCLLALRSHTDMAVYGLVAISLAVYGSPLSSMPRLTMVAFPAFGALANKLGARASALLGVLFAVGEIIFVQIALGPTSHSP